MDLYRRYRCSFISLEATMLEPAEFAEEDNDQNSDEKPEE